MKLVTTTNIWHNGRLIPWDDASIHVLSHVIHYGSSIFEGIRCYSQPTQDEDAVPSGAIFRLNEHMKRFLDSAKIYRMPIPFTAAELSTAVVSCDDKALVEWFFSLAGRTTHNVQIEVMKGNCTLG